MKPPVHTDSPSDARPIDVAIPDCYLLQYKASVTVPDSQGPER